MHIKWHDISLPWLPRIHTFQFTCHYIDRQFFLKIVLASSQISNRIHHQSTKHLIFITSVHSQTLITHRETTLIQGCFWRQDAFGVNRLSQSHTYLTFIPGDTNITFTHYISSTNAHITACDGVTCKQVNDGSLFRSSSFYDAGVAEFQMQLAIKQSVPCVAYDKQIKLYNVWWNSNAGRKNASCFNFGEFRSNVELFKVVFVKKYHAQWCQCGKNQLLL